MDQRPRKLKTRAAIISAFEGDKEVGRITTEFVPLYERDGLVTAVGGLFDTQGGGVGTVTVFNVPVSDWPRTAPVGRPKKTEKHLAVLLAWCLEVSKCRGK